MPVSRKLAWHAVSWLCVLGLAGLLWNLAAAGRTPSPWEFVIVMVACLIGSLILVGYGLMRVHSLPRVLSMGSILTGSLTFGAVVVFVTTILANDDAEVPVLGNAAELPIAVTKIRLFILNVDHGYPEFEAHEKRFHETVAELKRLKADVIVLQEAWNTNGHGNMAQRLSGDLGLQYVFARANGSRERIGFEEGAAILSRFPITEARRIVLKPRRPIWENRIALMVKIDVGGSTLTLAGVHLSNSDSADDQAEYLLEAARGHMPDIIAGDLNSTPTSAAVKAFVKEGFIEASPKNATAELWIDHVFLTSAFHARWQIKEAAWIIATQPVAGVRAAISDHDGIVVDLQRR